MMSGIKSFEEFVFRLQEPPYASVIKRYDHFRDQVDWLENPVTGELLIDFIGRFETLGQDFEYVKHRLGIEVSLPHRRKGADSSFRGYYSSDMVDIVSELYFRDVNRLGYDFEN